MKKPSNPRPPRTRFALLRSPLSRKPLGDGRRISASLLSAILLASVALGEDNPAQRLLGRWRSLDTSRGGIGSMMSFRKGGVVEYSVGAVVESPYRVERKELVLPSGTEGGPEKRQTITWLNGNKLRLASGGVSGLELARVGSRSSAPEALVGEWRGKQEMGGQKVDILYFFYPKGQALLLMPFAVQQGSYSTTKARIQLRWPNCPMPDAAFEVHDDVLILTPSNSKPARYARY